MSEVNLNDSICKDCRHSNVTLRWYGQLSEEGYNCRNLKTKIPHDTLLPRLFGCNYSEPKYPSLPPQELMREFWAWRGKYSSRSQSEPKKKCDCSNEPSPGIKDLEEKLDDLGTRILDRVISLENRIRGTGLNGRVANLERELAKLVEIVFALESKRE